MENNFVWTDELVYEFIDFYTEYVKSHEIIWTSVAVYEFKQSKLKKVSEGRFEKNFKILSFTDIYGDEVFWGGQGSFYTYQKWVDCCLAFEYTITKVERLTDNTIWKVPSKTNLGGTWEFYLKEPHKLLMMVKGELGYCHLHELKLQN